MNVDFIIRIGLNYESVDVRIESASAAPAFKIVDKFEV